MIITDSNSLNKVRIHETILIKRVSKWGKEKIYSRVPTDECS